MKPILDELPALYGAFFPELFQREIPEETYATCSTCTMLPKDDGQDFLERYYYSKDTKCCTYMPDIPNYLVGALLADKQPALDEGRRRMRRQIANGVGVTPRGVGPSARYQLLYREASREAFGRSRFLRCPYLLEETGGCGVWQFRAAVCSTWFCKYRAGEHGLVFWDTLRDWLGIVQHDLSTYVLLQLGIDEPWRKTDPKGKSGLSPEDIDEVRDPKVYQRYWGDWVGREEECFLEAFRIVQALTADDFERLLGVRQQAYVKKLERCLKRVVSPRPPQRPLRNPDLCRGPVVDGKIYVRVEQTWYSLPEVAWRLLDYFDGNRDLADVLAEIDEKEDIVISEGLIIAMFQQQILLDGSADPVYYV